MLRPAFTDEVADRTPRNSQKNCTTTKDQPKFFNLVADVAVRGVLAKLHGGYLCRFADAFALECFGNDVATETKNVFAFVGLTFPQGIHKSLFLLFLLLLFFRSKGFFIVLEG